MKLCLRLKFSRQLRSAGRVLGHRLHSLSRRSPPVPLTHTNVESSRFQNGLQSQDGADSYCYYEKKSGFGVAIVGLAKGGRVCK